MENQKITVPFLTERSYCSQSECYLQRNMYMQRILYWRNKTEHCSLKKSSEVGDHLLVNPDHNITWQILAKAPAQTFKRKTLQAFYIRKLKPTLNSQKDIKITHLFRNGIM